MKKEGRDGRKRSQREIMTLGECQSKRRNKSCPEYQPVKSPRSDRGVSEMVGTRDRRSTVHHDLFLVFCLKICCLVTIG